MVSKETVSHANKSDRDQAAFFCALMFHVVDKKIVSPPPAALWLRSAHVPPWVPAYHGSFLARSSAGPPLRARAACYIPVVQRKPTSRLVPRTFRWACTSLLSFRMQPSCAPLRPSAAGGGVGLFHVEHSYICNHYIHNSCSCKYRKVKNTYSVLAVLAFYD